MAHYCKYCGKKLEDGEVCNCQNTNPMQQAANTAPQSNPNMQPQNFNSYNTQYAPAPSATPSAFNRWVNNTKQFIKTPAFVGRTFIGKRQFKPALIFMAIYSLIGAFIPMIFASKINSLLSDIVSSISSIFSAADSLTPSLNLAQIYFTTAIISFIVLLIFALFIMLFAKLFKCNMSYSHAIAATGIYSITAAPFMLLAVLVALTVSNPFSFMICILITAVAVGKLLGLILTVESLKDDKYITNNNATYIVILAITALILCFFIFSSICLNSLIASLKDIGSLSNLESLF